MITITLTFDQAQQLEDYLDARLSADELGIIRDMLQAELNAVKPLRSRWGETAGKSRNQKLSRHAKDSSAAQDFGLMLAKLDDDAYSRYRMANDGWSLPDGMQIRNWQVVKDHQLGYSESSLAD